MAFSLRKMLSNINYFKKPGELDTEEGDPSFFTQLETKNIDFDRTEPDSTSKQCATSLKLPELVKTYTSQKSSLSDTDIMNVSGDMETKDKRKSKKLKLDIKKASQSMTENLNQESPSNVENTPKHVLLDRKSADLFSNIRGFDFNNSFDIFDAMSEDSGGDANVDIESLSDQSETDITFDSDDGEEIKMCRRVEVEPVLENRLVPSATPESFGDVEVDKNEEERISLLLTYQMKLEKLECFLKKMLSEFEFHIEVSKVFQCRSVVTTLPGTDVSKIPKILGEVTYIDNLDRGISPTGSWNIVMEKEDEETKLKLRKQLYAMKHSIEEFINTHLQHPKNQPKMCKKVQRNRRGITFDMHKTKRNPKRYQINHKKKFKHFDFPDYRDALLNLFQPNEDMNNTTHMLSEYEEDSKCICQCHRSPSETDSGLTTKNDGSISSQSITSSIGNFSLDSSTLTAFSESLDLIVSYNSFQDTSLLSTLLQKAAIERITFYVQVHSIQLKCDQSEQEYESKNTITFHCPACKSIETEENGLLRHILSQQHCEKIHFLYKTAYIKKCVSSGKEIQPSTVLNPMKMYRDDNKVVCFGDAMYACSLCFENLIVGESVLMGHCSDPEHVERRLKLAEMLE